MPRHRAVPRPFAMSCVLCLVLALPAAVSARSPACGAIPVIGRDRAVLYWTGRTDCAADERNTGGGDDVGPTDSAPVTRNSAPGDPTSDPMPESRPVSDPVTISG
jgi:hypothetical protein